MYQVRRELVAVPVTDLWDVAEGPAPTMKVVRWVIYGEPVEVGRSGWARLAECTSAVEAQRRVHRWQSNQLALMA